MTAGVSELVLTVSVCGPAGDGLMTPSNSMLTVVAGGDRLAAVEAAGRDQSVLGAAIPTCVLRASTSVTDVFPSALVMSVPDRERHRDRAARPGAIDPPVHEVAKLTKYTVRAPAAADGDEIVTVGWETWPPATML